MTVKEQLKEALGDVPALTDAEFEAVYDWATVHKDEWPEPVKSGLLKLVNDEAHRRL